MSNCVTDSTPRSNINTGLTIEAGGKYRDRCGKVYTIRSLAFRCGQDVFVAYGYTGQGWHQNGLVDYILSGGKPQPGDLVERIG
jgi:hypothetical protein